MTAHFAQMKKAQEFAHSQFIESARKTEDWMLNMRLNNLAIGCERMAGDCEKLGNVVESLVKFITARGHFGTNGYEDYEVTRLLADALDDVKDLIGTRQVIPGEEDTYKGLTDLISEIRWTADQEEGV